MRSISLLIANCILITIVVLALANTLNAEVVGINDTVLAQQQDNWPTTSIPFEITSDLDGLNLDRVSTRLTEANATTEGYIEAPLYYNSESVAFNWIALYDTQRRIVAYDVLRPPLRAYLVFSHENTARASIMRAHTLLDPTRPSFDNDLTDAFWISIYNAVDEHPRFEDYVALIRNTGYIPLYSSDPNHDAYYQVAFEIAIDLVREFFNENGSPKHNSDMTP